MLISIFVNKRDTEWQKNLEENRLIVIKDFSKNFHERFQELVCNSINEDGKNSWKGLKLQPFRTNWIQERKWLGDKNIYDNLYEMINDECTCIDLFDEVFGYSVNSLNEIIYNVYKCNSNTI